MKNGLRAPREQPAVNLGGSVNQRAREFERVGLGRRAQPPRLLSDPEMAGFGMESAGRRPDRPQTPATTRV